MSDQNAQPVQIQVQTVVVKLLIENKERTLTTAMARQLYIDHNGRRDRAENNKPGREVICKVHAPVITKSDDDIGFFLYLVVDEMIGLCWTRPMHVHADYARRVLELGGWIDDVADVPTALLV